MFDSVLGKNNVSTRRLGSGTIFSILTHIGIFFLIMWVGVGEVIEESEEPELVEIALLEALPPPPPPPPLATKKVEKKVKKKPKVKKDVLVEPEKPEEKKPEPEPEKEPEPEEPEQEPTPEVEGAVSFEEGGRVGGVTGGVKGGVVGGKVGNKLRNEAMPFKAGMKKPKLLTQKPLRPSKQARAAGIKGLAIARCIITVTGKIRSCKLIKKVHPFVDNDIISHLESRKYTPVVFQGKAVSVKYTFKLRFKAN